MALRVVSEEDTTSSKTAGKGRNKLWLAAGLAVVLVVVLIAALIVTRDPEPDPVPDGSGSVMVDAWIASRTDTVVENLAPGLDRCLSRVEGVNGSAINGWGIKFPRSLEGAVAHTAEAVELASSAAMWTDADARRKLFSQGFSEASVTFQLLERGINASGLVVDPAGHVVPTQTWHEAGYPRYGAYKVLNANRNKSGELDEVFIQWWMPKVRGIGQFEDLSGLKISWQSWTVVAQWYENDWISYGWYDMLPAWPSTMDRINTSFEDRAAVIGGDGWCIPLDGVSTEIIPGSKLAK